MTESQGGTPSPRRGLAGMATAGWKGGAAVWAGWGLGLRAATRSPETQAGERASLAAAGLGDGARTARPGAHTGPVVAIALQPRALRGCPTCQPPERAGWPAGHPSGQCGPHRTRDLHPPL